METPTVYRRNWRLKVGVKMFVFLNWASHGPFGKVRSQIFSPSSLIFPFISHSGVPGSKDYWKKSQLWTPFPFFAMPRVLSSIHSTKQHAEMHSFILFFVVPYSLFHHLPLSKHPYLLRIKKLLAYISWHGGKKNLYDTNIGKTHSPVLFQII